MCSDHEERGQVPPADMSRGEVLDSSEVSGQPAGKEVGYRQRWTGIVCVEEIEEE